MSMFWFNSRGPKLPPEQQQRIDELPLPLAPQTVPLRQQRLVVLDLETTGLHLKRDLVIAIDRKSVV